MLPKWSRGCRLRGSLGQHAHGRRDGPMLFLYNGLDNSADFYVAASCGDLVDWDVGFRLSNTYG